MQTIQIIPKDSAVRGLRNKYFEVYVEGFLCLETSISNATTSTVILPSTVMVGVPVGATRLTSDYGQDSPCFQQHHQQHRRTVEPYLGPVVISFSVVD